MIGYFESKDMMIKMAMTMAIMMMMILMIITARNNYVHAKESHSALTCTVC